MRIAIGGGITVPRDVDYIQEAERLGASSVWVPELWGADALTPLAYLGRDHDVDRAGLGHRPDRLAHAGDAGDDGDDVAGALRRALPARPRHQRPAGDGGLARRPLQSPIGATRETIEIVRTVARGDRLATTARSTSCRSRTAPAGRSARCCRPVEIPIYVAALGPQQPRADR